MRERADDEHFRESAKMAEQERQAAEGLPSSAAAAAHFPDGEGLKAGDAVVVAHLVPLQQNKSGRCVMKKGVAVYVHPEGRFAVVELEFPGGLWQKTVKLRETHWMEEIRRIEK